MTTLTTDVVKVKIQGISSDIEAKIDTGAEQSSLHGENITIKDETVIFQLNDRIYRAPLEKSQDVSSSDGGTQARPVIKASVEIEGQTIETLINLNDRSDMPQQMLVGKDIITAAGFKLDFGNSETDGQNKEEEEVAGAQEETPDAGAEAQSTPSVPNVPPVVNPTTPDSELAGKVLALTEEIVEMYKHISNLEASLNEIRKQAFGLLKGVGVVAKPSTPDAQPNAKQQPDVYKPYEQ